MTESDEIAAGGAHQVPLEELEQQLANLQARLPAHSISPSMIAELDELEEALARARRQWQQEPANRRK